MSLWSTLATTGLGATTTMLGIVAGGFVGRHSQDRQTIRDIQAAACAAFLGEYHVRRRSAHAGSPSTAGRELIKACLVSGGAVAVRRRGGDREHASRAVRGIDELPAPGIRG
jgi:hypothetical protein